MAVDFGPEGVRVNVICPGLIVHKRNEIADPVTKAAKENEYPVGRYGGADDIGHAVRFLCSEEASFITGVHLPVDGGLTIQLQDDFARKVLDHHTAAASK